MEYYNDDYLMHYGVLGQKWGVRRFQNKDGSLTNAGKKRYSEDPVSLKNDDKLIKKGSIVATVSTKNDIKFKNTPTYVYDNVDDAIIYRGLYSKDLLRNSPNKPDASVNEYVLRTKQDIKVAGSKTMLEEFDSFYKKNKDQIDLQMKPGFDALMNTNYARLINKKVSYDDVKNDSNKMFKIFNTYMDAYMYNLNNDPKAAEYFSLAKDYVNELQNKSYNALIDMNNKDAYYGAKSPIIILNGRDYVETADITKLSVTEIDMYSEYVMNVLGRTNKQHEYRNIVDEL